MCIIPAPNGKAEFRLQELFRGLRKRGYMQHNDRGRSIQTNGITCFKSVSHPSLKWLTSLFVDCDKYLRNNW